MNNTNAALACHRDRHSVFGYGIHTGTHHRNVQLDLLRQISRQIYLIRNHFGISRYQEHIVKCDSLANNLSHVIFLSF